MLGQLRGIIETQMRMTELEQVCARKDEFLAVLAHELRNQLAPISNALFLLNTNQVNEEMKKGSCELIGQQIKQMTRLVEDLMDVARINSGKIELRKKETNISALLSNAVNAVRPLAEQAGHKIITQIASESLEANIDSDRMMQVFSNLITNAIKYTPRDGLITVTLEARASSAVIKISDNGIGIPKDKLEGIFEMFSQVESERTKDGLGIGLALVKNIVTLHGGNIAVCSEGSNCGSEFTLNLPLVKKDTDTQKTQSMTSADLAKKSCRVLVVDDHREAAKTLGWMMEILGHTAELAYDGKHALEVAEKFLPDVVLMDISLPIVNGYEACRIMKENPLFANTLFIVQTGWSQKEYRDLAHQAGFDHYLLKPVKIDDLQAILATHDPASIL
jgi:CheY-like chemotaxis protein